MPARLVVAPAGDGKSSWVAREACAAARGLAASPIVCVAHPLQLKAMQERLAWAADGPGVIGVRVVTMGRLARACAEDFGIAPPQASPEIVYRLLSATLRDLRGNLSHFGAVADRPGMAKAMQELIQELKSAAVSPSAFAAGVQGIGGDGRLRDIAAIYRVYEERLSAARLTDAGGVILRATEALTSTASPVGQGWSHVLVDGFADLAPAQLGFLDALSRRGAQVVITLTGGVQEGGDEPGAEPGRTLQAFERARSRIESALGVRCVGLSEIAGAESSDDWDGQEPAIRYVVDRLYTGKPTASAPPASSRTAPIELLAAPDRTEEVRAALRWLKARAVRDGLSPRRLALLARDLSPYRDAALAMSAAMGLPMRLAGSQPLSGNPSVAALLELLRTARLDAKGTPSLPRRMLVEALRSPYFDWHSALHGRVDGDAMPDARTADDLDTAARWGLVIGGIDEWREALGALAGIGAESEAAGGDGDPKGEDASGRDEDERDLPPNAPTGARALALLRLVEAMAERLRPPSDPAPTLEHVRWLEALIGPDEETGLFQPSAAAGRGSLRLVHRCRQRAVEDEHSPRFLEERDIAALESLKDVLRALVLADELTDASRPVGLDDLTRGLEAAIDSAGYRIPRERDQAAVLLANVEDARGLPFEAVAIVGMAEGEFPKALREDPFLRDSERGDLRRRRGIELEPSTRGNELELFYEAIAQSRRKLLLTRPLLADNGALWMASPYWEEVRGWSGAEPVTLDSAFLPPPRDAASWPELLEISAALDAPPSAVLPELGTDAEPAEGVTWRDVDAGAAVVGIRTRLRNHGRWRATGRDPSAELPSEIRTPHEGWLGDIAPLLAQRYGPHASWSASGLETYLACPFRFFVSRSLGLQERADPSEGLEARQLGTIYHLLFEAVYQATPREKRADAEALEASLDALADEILDQAPRREGFRPTAWWSHTRDRILDDVRASLRKLCDPEIADGYVPEHFEARFGIDGAPELELADGADRAELRGLIDRVDVGADGRLRVIDYKTAGDSDYTKRRLTDGLKIQIVLYALAASDTLGFGDVADGFYWHIKQQKPSTLRLSKIEGGPDAAIDIAVDHTWRAVRGIRSGLMPPLPVAGSCPDYCPAKSFCWQYRKGYTP